jgi:protein farnesyltransferase subunit beta
LNLPLELPDSSPAKSAGLTTLLDGLPEYVGRCQSFEGGIASRPDAEAHGAYAFCAIACLCILGEPQEILQKYLDLPLLISWLSARQYAPEGGFAGRTNKLVDGCYSHWIGGCWPLIEAALERQAESEKASPDALYSREGLIRYILCACQDTGKRGGLRDKPSK